MQAAAVLRNSEDRLRSSVSGLMQRALLQASSSSSKSGSHQHKDEQNLGVFEDLISSLTEVNRRLGLMQMPQLLDLERDVPAVFSMLLARQEQLETELFDREKEREKAERKAAFNESEVARVSASLKSCEKLVLEKDSEKNLFREARAKERKAAGLTEARLKEAVRGLERKNAALAAELRRERDELERLRGACMVDFSSSRSAGSINNRTFGEKKSSTFGEKSSRPEKLNTSSGGAKKHLARDALVLALGPDGLRGSSTGLEEEEVGEELLGPRALELSLQFTERERQSLALENRDLTHALTVLGAQLDDLRRGLRDLGDEKCIVGTTGNSTSVVNAGGGEEARKNGVGKEASSCVVDAAGAGASRTDVTDSVYEARIAEETAERGDVEMAYSSGKDGNLASSEKRGERYDETNWSGILW